MSSTVKLCLGGTAYLTMQLPRESQYQGNIPQEFHTGEQQQLSVMQVSGVSGSIGQAVSVQVPDDNVRRYLVYLKYWTLNLMPLMVYPKVLSPPNSIILGAGQRSAG